VRYSLLALEERLDRGRGRFADHAVRRGGVRRIEQPRALRSLP
jgi:hypothetical protein